MARRATAEFVATALLLIAVIGSGIAAQRLSPGDTGLELLENALATGAALVAIILAFGPISGAHLNPAVTLADALLGGTRRADVPAYILAQVGGGVCGTIVANLMFGLPPVVLSTQQRMGSGVWLGEAVATFGLLAIVYGVVRTGHSAMTPFAVGAYITGAYWFTSSTSFANPAVAVARMFSNTFAGIAPGSVPAFVACQLAGAACAVGLLAFLTPAAGAPEALMEHEAPPPVRLKA